MPTFWIRSILTRLSIPVTSEGYLYLNIAISISIYHPNMKITELYEATALRLNVSAKYVRRVIRDTIQAVCKNADKRDFEELIGVFCNNTSKISNGRFIQTVALLAKLQASYMHEKNPNPAQDLENDKKAFELPE